MPHIDRLSVYGILYRILSSEGEEGKLAPHRVDKTRHSPAPVSLSYYNY